MKRKNSILDSETKELFLIKLYFNTSEGFEMAGVKRAYLDFNRTLHKEEESDDERNFKRAETEKYLISELKNILETNISNQSEFDVAHKKIVLNLVKFWKKLTIGQAQKWINMTLKYWLLFGESRIPNIEMNARFFHMPIDSYVQKEMFEEKNPKPWSQISTYEVYMDYQMEHRKKNKGSYPIIDEFVFFNEYES